MASARANLGDQFVGQPLAFGETKGALIEAGGVRLVACPVAAIAFHDARSQRPRFDRKQPIQRRLFRGRIVHGPARDGEKEPDLRIRLAGRGQSLKAAARLAGVAPLERLDALAHQCLSFPVAGMHGAC